MKTRDLLLGTLVGFTAGAVIGILFAPKKGSVTRRFLAQKGNNYIGEMKEMFSENLKTVNQKIDTLKDEVKNMVKQGLTKSEEEYKKSKV
jgi:gas vesicle protein